MQGPLRLRDGCKETDMENATVETMLENENQSSIEAQSVKVDTVPPESWSSLPPLWFWRNFISWHLFDVRFTLRFLFFSIDLNFADERPTEYELPYRLPEYQETSYIPGLSLYGFTSRSSNRTVPNENFGVANDNVYAREVAPLRLRGGGPLKPKPPKMPNPAADCKDLMAGFDKLMAEYKKALGPCGKATCPMNQNVLEDCCKKVCQKTPVPKPTPYCPPSPASRICPHLQDYSMAEGEEDIDMSKLLTCFDKCASPPDGRNTDVCTMPSCPFVKNDQDPFDDNFDDGTSEVCKTIKAPKAKPQPALTCTKHVCPFQKDEFTVDDVNPFNRKLKPKRGCGSPLCPHVARMEEPEVAMPKFPCRKPCPSTDELPPIHWECPDPLPTGECSNPFCPYREKPPCGHCPVDEFHCGYPGCPFAGDDICPPTCPYTQKKPPKHLDCTPSVCPLVRPDNYKSVPCMNQQQRKSGKDRCLKKSPCKNPHCPYDNEGMPNSGDECSDPHCPYKQAALHMAAQVEAKYREPETTDQRNTLGPISLVGQITHSGLSTKDPVTVDFRGSSKDKKVGQSKSVGILKLMTASLMQLKKKQEVEEDEDEPNVCRQSSCAQYNGDRMCKKCLQKKQNDENGSPLTNSPGAKQSEKKAKKKRKKQWGYVYDKGTYYPGTKFGHAQCNIHPPRVPWDMGWLWNMKETCVMLKTRKGWRPGAIGKTILETINAYRQKLGLPPRPMIRHPFPKRRTRSSSSGFNQFSSKSRSRSKGSHEPRMAQPKPTLSIKKKDGIVYVTMNPLKDPATMEDNEYPYIDCSPLEFKITKKNPDDELKKCLCNEDDADDSDKSSELDIEFTPPAGIVRPECMLRNRHVCHTESQYNKNDIPETEEEKEARKKKSKKGQKGKKGKKKR